MLHLHIVCAFPVALPLVHLWAVDVVAVVVLPLLILLRNNVLSGLYVVIACYYPVRATICVYERIYSVICPYLCSRDVCHHSKRNNRKQLLI